MTVRQFLLATQHPSAERRAEAGAALARAYLHGGLSADAAWEAKTAMLALLDDSATLVRRALAEACAASPNAPRPLIVALASDTPEVACLVLARSPVLMDADLVDCAAIGCDTMRAAVAGRSDLSTPVAAALAEVAGIEALTMLARNPYVRIGAASMLRIVERHGDDAELREAMLARCDLTIEVRHALAARVADSLAAFSQNSGWVSPERSQRMARDAREHATLSLGDEIGEAGLARLVAHLRAQNELNAGLILRAILSLRMPFAEAALADLGGLSRARVAGLMFDPKGAAFVALLRKAGLPSLLIPAIQAALTAWREAASGRSELHGARLARVMIERALTACETMPFAEGRGLMALLARFEAEAARDEARELAQAAAADAVRDEVLRIEQEQRLMLEDLRPEAVEVERAVFAQADGEVIAFPIEAILDELPQTIVASYRADQEQKQIEAASAVLDGLPDALMASFFASRAAPTSAEADQAPAIIVEHPRASRPRDVAVVVAAGMIPGDLIRSYRDDRARVRVAA